MHELSLAVNIVEIAVDEASRAGAKSVREVIIEAGALSGVDAEILRGALSFASKDTILESSVFSIKVPEGKGICSSCGKEFPMQDILTLCPDCGSPAGKLTAGTKFRVLTISVEDDD